MTQSLVYHKSDKAIFVFDLGEITMACAHCGAGDDTDRSAESQGLVYMAEAARRAKRSTTWINYRIQDGALETRSYAGRNYVTLASLTKLLSARVRALCRSRSSADSKPATGTSAGATRGN